MYEYVVGRGEYAGYCVATERFVLALHPGLQGSISAIWPLLESDDTHLEEVFARLIERGVSQAPDFAIAEIVDPVNRAVSAVVHGRAVAQLIDEPSSAVSGHGLSTWRESIWTGVRGFMLGVGDDRAGVERLPITGGVVRADWIRWSAEAPVLRDATVMRDSAEDTIEPMNEEVATTGNSGAQPPRRSRVRRPASDEPESSAAAATEPIAAAEPTPVPDLDALPDALEDTAPGAPAVVPPAETTVEESEPQPFLGNILSRPGVRLPDGSVVTADFPLVVGRNPTVRLAESGAPTVPVIVASPHRMVSSSHLQVEAAGRAVLLKDLGAKNGSLIRKPRSQPFVLADGAEALVPVGTTIDVGDGVVLEVVLE